MIDLHDVQDILRIVQNAGLILPILRTDTQRELLIELLFETDRPRTLSDLARAIDVDQTTVMREVNRLRKSGMIVEERVGRSRTVKINESSPFTGPLRQLIRVVYQPLSEDDSRRATERHRFRPGSGERRPLPSSRTRS